MAKLVTTVDSSRFVLICDHLGSNCLPLIQSLIHNRLKQLNVNMVCIENTSDIYLSSFRKPMTDGIRTEIKTIDFFAKYHTIDRNLSQELIQSLVDLSDESIILIDSLTPILLTDSIYEISRLLTQLSNRFRQLVCVLHVDCHSQYICESIEHLSHSVIHLTTKTDKCSDNCFKAIIRQRKAHRKTHFSVKQSMEFFTISDFSINYVKDNEKQELSTKTGQSSSGDKSTDPTHNLPFNLSLKDTELEAKNSLILPYIK